MTFAKATLVKLKTADGLCEVKPGVPIGREYRVDLSTVQDVEMLHVERQIDHMKTVIQTVDRDGVRLAWFPLELLRIEES